MQNARFPGVSLLVADQLNTAVREELIVMRFEVYSGGLKMQQMDPLTCQTDAQESEPA